MSRKYERIYRHLKEQITSGLLPPGAKLPPERHLMQQFAVSRPTVRHALGLLVSEGFIVRRVGSGSYVAPPKARPGSSRAFGLLIPGLGRGEIFEPICARIAELSQAYDFTLSWGASGAYTKGEGLEIVAQARRFAAAGVDGVFFQPLELVEGAPDISREAVDILTSSGIPIVLIDADYAPFPERSPYDLIGIDNIRAAYRATWHLCAQGARRVDFVSRPFTAVTAQYRRVGYRQALLDAGITPTAAWEHELDPEDAEAVRRMCAGGATDILCVNDETAALLMRTLDQIGYPCPKKVRVVGFDDVKYARLVRVPLTTVRQPCNAIAESAVYAMLSRVADPHMPARSIYLDGELVVRDSSLRKAR